MTSQNLFNGPVEVGLRVLSILVEAYPSALDIQRLIVLDYFVVHTGDLDGGPPSLHSKSPLRSGEIAIRRGLIEKALNLYSCRGLIGMRMSRDGISYCAEESSANFLDSLNSEYATKMRERAEWVFSKFGKMTDSELYSEIGKAADIWRSEFSPLGRSEAPL